MPARSTQPISKRAGPVHGSQPPWTFAQDHRRAAADTPGVAGLVGPSIAVETYCVTQGSYADLTAT